MVPLSLVNLHGNGGDSTLHGVDLLPTILLFSLKLYIHEYDGHCTVRAHEESYYYRLSREVSSVAFPPVATQPSIQAVAIAQDQERMAVPILNPLVTEV